MKGPRLSYTQSQGQLWWWVKEGWQQGQRICHRQAERKPGETVIKEDLFSRGDELLCSTPDRGAETGTGLRCLTSKPETDTYLKKASFNVNRRAFRSSTPPLHRANTQMLVDFNRTFIQKSEGKKEPIDRFL